MLDQIKSWVTGYVRSVLNSIIRVAEVDSTDPDKATVRVRLGDDDDLISHDLRVLVRKTHMDKDYWMPDVGEHVLCLFLPFGLEQGFVLGAFYSEKDQPPVQSQDKKHLVYDDGTWLEYDRSEHLLSGHIKGWVDLTVDKDMTADIGNDAKISVGRDIDAQVGRDMSADVGQNATLKAGEDIKADAGNNAEITASGQHIRLSAPLVVLAGSITMQDQQGSGTTEQKQADTEHVGSYFLSGSMNITGDLHVGGDITCGGSNPNHHSH